jgi:hypothetical protein
MAKTVSPASNVRIRESNDRSPLVGTQAREQSAIHEKVAGFLERPSVRTHGVVELIDARLNDDNVLAPAAQSKQNDARPRPIPRLYESYIVFIYGVAASPPPDYERS